ncbi:MAG TPA: DNA polymerase IV [Candidatus Peribacteraceae bacterium]|nr:DNA polymerase IV [Candidatus Peribacteraceae bacterium]
MKKGSIIAHLDADCFYVSCERIRNAGLKGKPVGVLGNQGACIIAKSYELRAKGVATGIPIWDAHRLCPEAIYVKRDFQWYEVLSRLMLDLIKTYSLTVEYYSIDELFFDASLLPIAFQSSMLDAAKALQQRILKEIGLPVTIGIAETKLLAKLASDTAKPFGCTVWLNPEDRKALLKEKPVSDITGIAKRREKTLQSYGIYTCDQFVAADRKLIRKLVTKMGEDMWWELNGISVLPLQTERPPHKMVARGGSIGAASADRLRIEGWLIRNVERLVDALDHYGYVADQLGLYLGYKEGFGSYGSTNLLAPTALFEDLAPAVRALFDYAFHEGKKIHYIHIIAEHLQFKDHAQRSLFEKEKTRPTQTAIMRQVNASAGRFAVRSAATLPLPDIYSDIANDYDICDVYGKSCF